MAALASLSPEERIGVGAAIVAHVALAAALTWQFGRDMVQLAPPERIDVSLATDVSLESTAPDPSAEPAASYAPVITDIPQPPAEIVEQPAERAVQPPPQPVPQPTARRATATPTPAPTPSPTARRTPTPAPSATPSATRSAGGSRLSDDFLEGRSASEGRSGSPAATFGAAEAASLQSAITRQLRPHWSAPQGVDAELLVTVVRFRLNPDGSLAGAPSCIRQSGETASNAPQAALHCERAIRAVRLAAPFNLPEQFYDQWRTITSQFDRRL